MKAWIAMMTIVVGGVAEPAPPRSGVGSGYGCPAPAPPPAVRMVEMGRGVRVVARVPAPAANICDRAARRPRWAPPADATGGRPSRGREVERRRGAP